MLVSFDELPDEARIWIYPSDRSFKKEEIIEIQKEGSFSKIKYGA